MTRAKAQSTPSSEDSKKFFLCGLSLLAQDSRLLFVRARSRETITVFSTVDTEVHGRIGSRPGRELTAEAAEYTEKGFLIKKSFELCDLPVFVVKTLSEMPDAPR